jgi:bifunctional polynucleotide phosphatase/kinase
MPCVPRRVNDIFISKTNYIFVIFSNQLNLNSKIAERASFESKIDSIISKLGISEKCPIVSLFATSRDEYRKPCTGMWQILENEFLRPNGCFINLNQSFFVGDAAGRLASWKPGKSADWSAVDRKFACNLNLTFHTPEEYFLNEPHIQSFDLGFNPKTLLQKSDFDSFSFSISDLRLDASDVKVFLAVGSPASGKSTFYEKLLKDKGVIRINRDTLKTVNKCLTVMQASLSSMQSVYIDNTHPSVESRNVFISIAKTFNVPIICLNFVSDPLLSRHLDVFRSITTRTDTLPPVAFNSFFSKFQPPNLEEGFETIHHIKFESHFLCDKDVELFSSYLF